MRSQAHMKKENYKSQDGIPTDCPVRRRVYLIKETMKIHGLEEVIYIDKELESAAEN
jgi:hypothetical protein